MAARLPDKRTRLVQTAVKLVHEQGFHRTTLADIAEAADVPLGNVYYYFKTKDAIGEALIEERASEFRTLRGKWDDTLEPRARLCAFVQMTVDHRRQLVRSGCPIGSLCAELHKEGGPLAQRAAALFDESLTWLKAQFRALGHGEASGDHAIHLLAALQGATLLAHTFHAPSYIVREADRLTAWIDEL